MVSASGVPILAKQTSLAVILDNPTFRVHVGRHFIVAYANWVLHNAGNVLFLFLFIQSPTTVTQKRTQTSKPKRFPMEIRMVVA